MISEIWTLVLKTPRNIGFKKIGKISFKSWGGLSGPPRYHLVFSGLLSNESSKQGECGEKGEFQPFQLLHPFHLTFLLRIDLNIILHARANCYAEVGNRRFVAPTTAFSLYR